MNNEHLCNGGPEDGKQCRCGLTQEKLEAKESRLNDDICTLCGHHLGHHPAGLQAQAGGGQAFSLGDVDDIFAMALRKKYMPKCYNSMRGKTNSATSNMKNYVLGEYGNKCAVCQSQDNVTVAHILKRKQDCSLLKVEWDASNFIALCGTEGEVGTCYSLFDNFQMSFVYITSVDAAGWRVVGGKSEYHQKLVNLATNPPKRSLHSHFARCVLNESLLCVNDDYDYDYDLDVSDEMEDLG